MAGGSREPEGPDDHQCQNCGRWYNRVGLQNHEPNCPHPDWADPVVPIRETDDHPMLGGETAAETSPESTTEPARTDGGEGLGLEGPPEPETEESDEPSDGLEEEEGDDGLNCTNCGDPLGVTDDDLAGVYEGNALKLECAECGNLMRWEP